jgi:hypothetical protein
MGLCGLTLDFLQTSNSYHESSQMCWIETNFISKQNKHGDLCLHCAPEDRMWSLQIQPPLCDKHSQVADLVSQIPCSKLTDRRWQMIVWLVHNALGSMWKDIILTFSEVLSQYLPGGTDENSDILVRTLRLRFEHVFRMWHQGATYSIVTSGAWTWVGDNFKMILEEMRMQVLTKLNQSRIWSMIFCECHWILWRSELTVKFSKMLCTMEWVKYCWWACLLVGSSWAQCMWLKMQFTLPVRVIR